MPTNTNPHVGRFLADNEPLGVALGATLTLTTHGAEEIHGVLEKVHFQGGDGAWLQIVNTRPAPTVGDKHATHTTTRWVRWGRVESIRPHGFLPL